MIKKGIVVEENTVTNCDYDFKDQHGITYEVKVDTYLMEE